jgi:hypothetical protein
MLVFLACYGFAKTPTQSPAPSTGELVLDSGPGSYRAEGTGHLELTTKGGVGTVYISGLVGTVHQEGMRLEYQKGTRLCYHGIGKVVIDGKFRAINFLGESVSTDFKGNGIFELYGDLDRNGNTGLVWYPGFLKDNKQVKETWETYGRVFTVPRPKNYVPADFKNARPQMLNE